MNKIIIGIDPDTKAHGVAMYLDNKLTVLKCMTLMELHNFLTCDSNFEIDRVVVHMENVKANNAVFMPHGRMDKKREGEAKARGRTLGMCQQSQTEIERMLEWLGIEIIHHSISKRWKKEKSQFEGCTGWTARSNEDTRSAAYFGFIGIGMGKAVLSGTKKD
mgnify:CR=1 FL=1